VHVGYARLRTHRLPIRVGTSCGLALLCFLIGSRSLQNAVAEGDTRTISMHHMHTGEDISITYKREGRYDDAALEKLNWFLRDWRRSEQTKMDPHLIDLVWEVQRESAPNTPIQVVCGYRSPETNAMLRHRSANTGVARFSQHMLGHAMDFYIPGVKLEQLREYGLRLQRGGVGFYPESGSPFVHMDTGGIRMWPRMTHEELARVFPDGRTVHIPSDGRPLSGYALALADVRQRGAEPSANSIDAARNAGLAIDTQLASNDRPHVNPFAKLLGLAKDEDDEDDTAAPSPAVATTISKHPVLAALEHDAQRGAQVSVQVGAKVGAEVAAAGKATATAAVKVADAASKIKLIRTASAATLPPQPAAGAATTPNQVIVARGFWEGPADGTAVANNPAVASSQHPAPAASNAANTDTDSTASIGPFVNPHADQPAAALAYADQPNQDPRHDPTGIAALRAAALPAQLPAGSTTIAVKRAANQVASAVVTAGMTSLTVIKAADAHLRNPWLRAIVLSPSVHRFLTTATLGARDFRTLAAQMVKPASSVIMTFSADPNPGLDHDHFTGAAIVFVSTVSYTTRTASLQ
jgi:uncharacterized protein YcbK (DUF882 family)